MSFQNANIYGPSGGSGGGSSLDPGETTEIELANGDTVKYSYVEEWQQLPDSPSDGDLALFDAAASTERFFVEYNGGRSAWRCVSTFDHHWRVFDGSGTRVKDTEITGGIDTSGSHQMFAALDQIMGSNFDSEFSAAAVLSGQGISSSETGQSISFDIAEVGINTTAPNEQSSPSTVYYEDFVLHLE